jgi:hypothetical protein
LQSVTQTGGEITLTWSSVPCLTYQVQCANSLTNPNWTNVASAVTAAGTLANVSEAVGAPKSQRFYRVILMPCP